MCPDTRTLRVVAKMYTMAGQVSQQWRRGGLGKSKGTVPMVDQSYVDERSEGDSEVGGSFWRTKGAPNAGRLPGAYPPTFADRSPRVSNPGRRMLYADELFILFALRRVGPLQEHVHRHICSSGRP